MIKLNNFQCRKLSANKGMERNFLVLVKGICRNRQLIEKGILDTFFQMGHRQACPLSLLLSAILMVLARARK